jgi:RNA polymerase sigma-70 factor (ECF subfamily)
MYAMTALAFQRFARFSRPALVNGVPGLVAAPEGRPFSVMGFTITDGRIVQIDILADPLRLAGIDLTLLD